MPRMPRKNTVDDPPDLLRDAVNWIAASNNWGRYRYLLKGDKWYVQTDEGGFDGETLVNIYADAMLAHLNAKRRRVRRWYWTMTGVGLAAAMEILHLIGVL